ncbi:MAG: ATP-binding protein [Pseudomonadales bacterium]|nr:ATP-binding protein [Pseudomonadales bacterium]
MDSGEDYRRAYEIQRKAREVAELRLEEKARELYEKNESLRNALDQVAEQQQKLISQEKYASIGQLSAGLAHEINNPNAYVISNLGALRGYVENLCDGVNQVFEALEHSSGVPKDVNAKVAEIKESFDFEFIHEDIKCLLKETENGTQRIKRIVQGLQYFSNQDPSQVQDFDLKKCVEHSVVLVENEESVDSSFQLDIQEIPRFNGVMPLISQAIVNVLRNADQAKPKSGVVKVTARVVYDDVLITIEDDGMGIKESDLTRVFDPFYTTKDYVNGLGLTISQAVVKQHFGFIDVDSKWGEYSRFSIHLPLNHK